MNAPRRAPRIGETARRPLRAAALLACALLASGCAGRLCDSTGERCIPGDTSQRYDELLDWYAINGLMRTEIAPEDAPVDRSTLARNFEIVALNSEFAPGQDLKEERTPVPLSRWNGEITWSVEGDAAGPADRAELKALISRIAAATGLNFRELPVGRPRNGHIRALILTPQERLDIAVEVPRLGANALPLVAAWSEDDRFPCIGQLLARDEGGTNRRGGLLLIKGETSGILRRACLHEEFTQVLGLINDGEEVRPSIFNDDQEFALLTRHDELLLKILYDPRLRDGMSAEEARPVIEKIVADLDI